MSCWLENDDVAVSGKEVDHGWDLTMFRLNGAQLTDFRISVMNDDDGGNDGDFLQSLSTFRPIPGRSIVFRM